jgi:hypothetical protein
VPGLGPEGGDGTPPHPPKNITRFHGTVAVDPLPLRAGSGAGRIADEVMKHLSGLAGSRVGLTLEVQAEVPDGIPEDRQRSEPALLSVIIEPNHSLYMDDSCGARNQGYPKIKRRLGAMPRLLRRTVTETSARPRL